MRIAVIDDEKYSRGELIHLIGEVLPEAEVREAASGAQALKLFDRTGFDLLFVDIHLGDMEGLTLASLARRLMPEAKVVFATAFSQYAVQAFELRADDYLLKPFDPIRVRRVLERHFGAISAEPPAVPLTRLAIHCDRRTILLDPDSVLYIETDRSGRGCVLHAFEEDYSDSATLGDYEARLADRGFYRIHKSFLVQLRFIQDIFAWGNNGFGLRVQGHDEVLPIGRDRIKGLRQKLAI